MSQTNQEETNRNECVSWRILRLLSRYRKDGGDFTRWGRPLDEDGFVKLCSELGVENRPSEWEKELDRLSGWMESLAETGIDWATYRSREEKIGALVPGDRTKVAGYLLACAAVESWLRRIQGKITISLEVGKMMWALEQQMEKLAERKLIWQDEQLNQLVEHLAPREEWDSSGKENATRILAAVLAQPGILDRISESNRKWLPAVRDQLAKTAQQGKSVERKQIIAAFIGMENESIQFNEVNLWGKRANELVAEASPEVRRQMGAVLAHGGTITIGKPSKKWLAEAENILTKVEIGKIRDVIVALLNLMGPESPLARSPRDQLISGADWQRDYERVRGAQENCVRIAGVSALAVMSGDDYCGNAVVECLERIAAMNRENRQELEWLVGGLVRALAVGDKPHMAGLQRLTYRVKWPVMRKMVAKALKDAGGKLGLSPVDAEELGVPDFGMVGGRVVVKVGQGTAEIEVVDTVEPRVIWRKGDGSIVKNGAALAQTDAEGGKSAKQVIQDVRGMLPAQRNRLELLLRDTRTWRIDVWQQRYLTHGLLKPFTERLLWNADGIPVTFSDGKAKDVTGAGIDLGETAEISLWHPIGRPVEEVLAWRERLEVLGITQPFKQAHREVYLLTEAERRTRTYSNRFAAHIVKTATLIAIGQTRRWKVSLYGMATLDLPQFGLRAEYWSNEIGDERNDMGAPVYLSTDQVRFYREGMTEPMPLEEVPEVVLSEVMRDVDMFVGIGSIAADPNWADGGNQGRYRDYWHSTNFGDLGASAKVRRAVLERLLPRMTRLAGKWELGERFLRVQGKLRAYKIHLGSTNILMEPNDQYLCIVPDRRMEGENKTEFVPFEGDNQMSVILSKALMLIEDDKITDVTITRQIGK